MKPKLPNAGLPLRAEMCSTCPFRPGVAKKYAAVRETVTESALTEATRICHQTGSNNTFHRRTGKPEAVCRGARDLQLQFFYRIGFLKEPTDKAWDEKFKEIQNANAA